MKLLPFSYGIAPDKTLSNPREIDLEGTSCCGIIGPVGSGKSQLIKLLADPNRHPVAAWSEYPFCAYLSQDLTRLFTGNTAKSILDIYSDTRYTVGKHFSRDLFFRYAACLNVAGLIDDDRRLSHYSEGERQRLGICLAAAVRAPVTILDEPTTALDIECRKLLYDIIDEIRRRSYVFVISHRLLDCLSVCDHMIRVSGLKVEEHFPIEQILEKPHILSYYSVLQKEDSDV